MKIKNTDHLSPAEAETGAELGNTHDWCNEKPYEWGISLNLDSFRLFSIDIVFNLAILRLEKANNTQVVSYKFLL